MQILIIFLIISIVIFIIFFMINRKTMNMRLNNHMPNLFEQVIKMKKDLYENYEDDLKELSKKDAEISEEAIKIKVQAVKEGFDANKVYCKHCGSLIDKDSKFCKSCGKKCKFDKK